MQGLRLSPLLVGGAAASASAGNAAILAMSPTAYYDLTASAVLYQSGTRASPGTAAAADGDPVGLVLDLSGNAIDLAQSTSGKRPLLKISGGVRYLLFDGVDDALTATYSDTSQNWNAVNGFRIIAAGAGNQVHGHSGGNVTVFASGTGYTMFGNPTTGPAISVSNGTDAVVTENWLNPGSNSLQLDKNAAVTSPALTSNFGQDVGIGGNPSGSGNTNIRWHGGVRKRGTVFTAPQLATIQTYFGGLQGRTI